LTGNERTGDEKTSNEDKTDWIRELIAKKQGNWTEAAKGSTSGWLGRHTQVKISQRSVSLLVDVEWSFPLTANRTAAVITVCLL
jgi:transposase